MTSDMERHPLQPFIPPGAQLLMLGSFPPSRERWSMDFFYPNFINDMWRVMGHIYFEDKQFFVDEGRKTFHRAAIEQLLSEAKIAIYDVAVEVNRLKQNASDKFLEIVTPTDLHELIGRMPEVRALVSTGQKSGEEVCKQFEVALPVIGQSVTVMPGVSFFRMPSTSRAYPMKVEQKAEWYKQMLTTLGLYPLNDEARSRVFGKISENIKI